MRRSPFRLLAMLLVLIAVIPFAGCSCSGQPTLTLRNPFQIDSEPNTVAGARMMAVPAYLAPSYAPAAAAPGCSAPGYSLPPGYAPTR